MTYYSKIELVIDFRRRLVTALDSSGVYTALYNSIKPLSYPTPILYNSIKPLSYPTPILYNSIKPLSYPTPILYNSYPTLHLSYTTLLNPYPTPNQFLSSPHPTLPLCSTPPPIRPMCPMSGYNLRYAAMQTALQ